MLRNIMFILVILLLSSCSNTIKLQLDAINTPGYDLNQHPYLLLNGNPDINSRDLYFQEFKRFTDLALKKAGLPVANNPQNATQIIYLSFGVSDGTTERYTYTTPIYDYVGGDTYTIKEKTVSDGKADVTTTEVYVPFSRQVVGRERHTRTITQYQSYVRLEGRDNSEAAAQRWMVTVEATSGNNDLRTLMPIMLNKAIPYIGHNSGKVIQLDTRLDDTETQRFINELNSYINSANE